MWTDSFPWLDPKDQSSAGLKGPVSWGWAWINRTREEKGGRFCLAVVSIFRSLHWSHGRNAHDICDWGRQDRGHWESWRRRLRRREELRQGGRMAMLRRRRERSRTGAALQAATGGVPPGGWCNGPAASVSVSEHFPVCGFKVELNRGNNVLYWRTTAFSVWSKVSKPVLVRNIAITGMDCRQWGWV